MSDGRCPNGGQWWTCTDQTSTFAGCCLVDPCKGENTGCPENDSFPAAFASAASSSSSTLQTTSRPTSTSPSTTSSFTTSSSSHTASLPTIPSPSPSLSRIQVHAIIGGSTGGAVVLFLLIALCLTWHRAKNSRKLHISQPPLRPAPTPFAEITQTRPAPGPTLPYLQTNLRRTSPQPRTVYTYSAYSPDHITPSLFDSRFSATDQPFGGQPTSLDSRVSGIEELVRRHTGNFNSDEAYYPGRPTFGIPSLTQSPEAIAEAVFGRRSLGSDSQGPSPPPTYVSPLQSPLARNLTMRDSNQHYPTSPTSHTPPTSPISQISSRPQRTLTNFSYPTYVGASGIAPAAAVTDRGSQWRSDDQNYDPRLRPMISAMQSDKHSPGVCGPRRQRAPAQTTYEILDSFEDGTHDLPQSHDILDAAKNRWRDRDRPKANLGKARALRVRTLGDGLVENSRNPVHGSLSAIDRHSNPAWSPILGETMESINAVGATWGGDMRMETERMEDAQRDREMQRLQTISYTSWQTLTS